ncbi:MAG: ATP-binding cassette domain-containing protein [Clostridiales bacterium]|nr:ATP-binding cassette domain-containing protein [Clostridiales bacterium]
MASQAGAGVAAGASAKAGAGALAGAGASAGASAGAATGASAKAGAGAGAGAGATALLRAERLTKTYAASSRRGFGSARLTAVNEVSFEVARGETFGLVGESGCGKSTLAMLALRLIEPTSGALSYEGRDMLKMGFRELREIRRDMQVVFQDPYDSMNPRLTLEEVVAEPLRVHGRGGTKRSRRERVEKLFADVGLPAHLMGRYPHQLSGGQRQRLCIARAIALSPRLVVCDEAVSALDVSIQAQILNLLLDLKDEFGLTYMFISHNLAVVKFMSDRIGVMYFGRIVELAAKAELFGNVLHPYTLMLLSAMPSPVPGDSRGAERRAAITGGVPSLFSPPAGCVFHPRCRFREGVCEREEPPLRDMGGGHCVACHFAGEHGLPRLAEQFAV